MGIKQELFIVECYKTMSIRAIANHIGISRDKVSRALDKHHIKRRTKKEDEELKKKNPPRKLSVWDKLIRHLWDRSLRI